MSGLTHNRTAPGKPDRVVVLGAKGFVGGAVVAELTRAGISCLGLSSRDLDLLGPGADELLARQLQPNDTLVVVSALTPDRGKDTATFMKNLRMMESVCAALIRRTVAHVVNIGSDAVYSDDSSLVDEWTPVAPGGFHGMMHAARETMLRSTVSAPTAFLRPSLLYGANDTHNGYGPNRFRRTAAAESRITLFGRGEEKRDHVHIGDIATLVRLTLENRSSGVLNLATGHSASFREVADLVAGQFTKQVTIIEQPRSGGSVTHRHFTPEARLRAFPDFRPISLADGIATAHREAQHG